MILPNNSDSASFTGAGQQLDITSKDGCVIFRIRVQPRASRDEIAGVIEGALKVRVQAPAVENRANEAICEYLASLLKTPKSAVRILGGERSRMKRVEILGVHPREILALLSHDASALAKDRESSFDDQLLIFYGLLTDLLELTSHAKQPQLRNPHLAKELESLSKSIDVDWVMRAIAGFDELHLGSRRNLNRQLGLDALAASLAPNSQREVGSHR